MPRSMHRHQTWWPLAVAFMSLRTILSPFSMPMATTGGLEVAVGIEVPTTIADGAMLITATSHPVLCGSGSLAAMCAFAHDLACLCIARAPLITDDGELGPCKLIDETRMFPPCGAGPQLPPTGLTIAALVPQDLQHARLQDPLEPSHDHPRATANQFGEAKRQTIARRSHRALYEPSCEHLSVRS